MSHWEDVTARAVAKGAELGVRARAAGHLPLCHPFPEKGAGQPDPLLGALGKFSFASSAAVVWVLSPLSLSHSCPSTTRGYCQDSISEAAGKAE